MPFTQKDIQAIQEMIAPLIGEEVRGAHRGYAARLTINFGVTPTKEHERWSRMHGGGCLWTDTAMWHIEDESGVLAAYEDTDSIQHQAVERLNGRHLLSVDVAPLNAVTTFNFDSGLVVRLFPMYMDPQANIKHWLLFMPHGKTLTLGSGTTWSYKGDSTMESMTHDAAIKRFEVLCGDLWPCRIASLTVQQARGDAMDHLDLALRLYSSNRADMRQLTLSFQGVQYLNLAQDDVETELESLLIDPIGDRGWKGLIYNVHNPGQHILTFYCASFDVFLE